MIPAQNYVPHIALAVGVKLSQHRQIWVRSLHDLQHRRNCAKIEVLKAVVLKIWGCWGVSLLVVVNFPKFLHGLKMKELRSFETSGLFTETKERHIKEDLILQTFYTFHRFPFTSMLRNTKTIHVFSIKTLKFEILRSRVAIVFCWLVNPKIV